MENWESRALFYSQFAQSHAESYQIISDFQSVTFKMQAKKKS